MTGNTPVSDPETPLSGTGSSRPLAASCSPRARRLLPPPGRRRSAPSCRHSKVTNAMTSNHDQPPRSTSTISPHPGPGWLRGRRVAMLLAGAAPLAAAALATAPMVASSATTAPPAAAHVSAMLTNPDCLAAFSGHQAPKYPQCLGD
jgi:hypothetical protein